MAAKPESNLMLQALVAKYTKLHGYSKEELAVKLHMGTSTFYRKLQKPDSFTFKEIQGLFKILKFTPEEKLSILL